MLGHGLTYRARWWRDIACQGPVRTQTRPFHCCQTLPDTWGDWRRSYLAQRMSLWGKPSQWTLLQSLDEPTAAVHYKHQSVQLHLWYTTVFLPRDATQSAVMRQYFVLTVRLSVTFKYRDHIGWNISKIISRLISLSFMLFLVISRAIWCNGNTGIGVGSGAVKPTISLKRCKIGPRLLWQTNRKSHALFRLVPKSMTLNDLERPKRTVAEKNRFTELTRKIWTKLDPNCQGQNVGQWV